MHTIRTAVVAILIAEGERTSDFDACALACSELISNAMRHGPSEPIDVALHWGELRPTLAVRDRGRGFTPRIALPDRQAEGGRGLYLVANLVGTPKVRSDETGCTVTVVLPVLRRKRN